MITVQSFTPDVRRARVFSLLFAVLIQIPFAVLSYVPHHEFGAFGPGIMFFVPSLALVHLFPFERMPLVIAVVACQTAIIAIPVFWLVTWRNRSISGTLGRSSCFVGVIVAATASLLPLERHRDERRAAIQAAGSSAVLGNIERVNWSLAFFKSKYGEYPDNLERLDFPPASAPVDSRHAALIEFPLPMEEFFAFKYTRRPRADAGNAGYELNIDAKTGKWSNLYHYCSDESGSIRFDANSDACKRGPVVKHQ